MTDASPNKHRLFNMLMSAPEVTECEIQELFNDLRFIFENPFDSLIEEAVTTRDCTYIEVSDQKAS